MFIASKNNKSIQNSQRDIIVKHTENSSDNKMAQNIVRVKIKTIISL
jgi:hypothetical protein